MLFGPKSVLEPTWADLFSHFDSFGAMLKTNDFLMPLKRHPKSKKISPKATKATLSRERHSTFCGKGSPMRASSRVKACNPWSEGMSQVI